jgi:hypothetical protein
VFFSNVRPWCDSYEPSIYMRSTPRFH